MSDRFTHSAILLAAGLGTRMAPLTDSRPKPLIPVLGAPLIDRVVANCLSEGITQFAVNAHYLAEQVAAHITAGPVRFPGAKFRLSDEREELLGTGGGVKKALKLIEGDPFFVLNTDAIWPQNADTPLERMREVFAQGEADAVLLCAHPARAYGFRRSHDFCLAPDKTITNDRGVPVIYAGAALLKRSLFADTPDGPFSLYDIMMKAQEAGRLQGVMLNAAWLHVGDPQGLKDAEAYLSDPIS